MLYREVMDAPSLETSKNRLDGALGNLTVGDNTAPEGEVFRLCNL